MKISVKGEYALQAVLDLSAHEQNVPVKIADIAKRQRIPQKFLELILSGLKQGGFVESRRGAEGGYLLARAAQNISVGEVLRYVEGGGRTTRGKKRAETPFTDMWQRVDSAVSDVVDRTSFADVLRAWREKQANYVPNWDI
jgi:Rrf2 family protein